MNPELLYRCVNNVGVENRLSVGLTYYGEDRGKGFIWVNTGPGVWDAFLDFRFERVTDQPPAEVVVAVEKTEHINVTEPEGDGDTTAYATGSLIKFPDDVDRLALAVEFVKADLSGPGGTNAIADIRQYAKGMFALVDALIAESLGQP
jgi:hypothetical protein